MGYKVLWLSKTGDANAWYHIYPFVKANNTETIDIVRIRELQRPIVDDKAKFHFFSAKNRLQEVIRFLKTGHKLLVSKEIDFIITFGLFPWGVFAWILSRLHRKPILIGMIGRDFNQHTKRGRLSFLLKYILKKATILTTPGLAMSNELRETLRMTDGILEYGHCLESDQIVYNSNIELNETLISVSDFKESKRTKDIIEAIKILKDDGIDVKLKLLGGGGQKKILKGYVKAIGLEDRVEFLGYRKDLVPFWKQGSIYIQASLNEGLSLSLVEAMGMGLIPIVTKAGCEEDIITDGVNGLFVEKMNPDDIAEKIKHVVNQDNYNRLRDGLEKNKGNLHINSVISQAESLQEILASH